MAEDKPKAEFQKKDGVEPVGEIADKPSPPAYSEPPFVGGSRGLSPAELLWHRSRRPQPVTGSAFALDPTAIHECDDVVAQLQLLHLRNRQVPLVPMLSTEGRLQVFTAMSPKRLRHINSR
jgi:hypothetical protein